MKTGKGRIASIEVHTMVTENELQTFLSRLDRLLAEWEVGTRDSQRTMEIISCLLNDLDGEPELLPIGVQRIFPVVIAWNRGDRPDADTLATIAALARHHAVTTMQPASPQDCRLTEFPPIPLG